MQALRIANADRRAATRALLLAAARELFAGQGFAETGTEHIVAHAGVTRGALYFHFADKTALFAAVADEVAHEIADAIDEASPADAPPLEQLREGSAAYLDACIDPTRRRIYLVDGPAVLGATDWHALENRYSAPLLAEGVRAALARPGTHAFDAEALTRLLSGALVEGALWLAEAPDADAVRPRLLATLDTLLERLFAGGDGLRSDGRRS